MSKSKRKPTREQIIARGQFETLKNLMQTYAGYRAKEPDMQRVYSTFPDFEFDTLRGFGEYKHFGQAYEHKILDYEVSAHGEILGYIHIRLYTDLKENVIYTEEAWTWE